MKRITRVIGMITGAISSLFVIGCDRLGGKIYGPPDMVDEYQRTGEIKHSDALDRASDVSDKLEIEAPPSAIYGPPEMLDGGLENADIPESEGVPADIYGPPEMFESPVVETEPSGASMAAQNKDEFEDDADKKVRDKDFETLKKVNHKQAKKTIYGPPKR